MVLGKFRGRFAAMLTIAGLVACAALVSVSQADEPKPAKKDSGTFARPRNAAFTTSVEPAQAKPGETVVFKVTVKLEPGAHIYKYSRKQGPGPINTSFDFFDKGGLEPDGDWTPSREPEAHKDPAFPDIDVVEYYEDEVTWSHKLKVPGDAREGRVRLRTQARYMVCTEKNCSFPGQWTLPAAELLISGVAGTSAAPKLADAKPVGTATATKGPEPKPAAPAPAPTAGDSAAVPAAKTPPALTAALEGAPSISPTTLKETPATEAAGQVESEIAKTAKQGIVPFLIASAFGGLFALVMPCVWPMVPVTVNFFVKQGAGPGGRKRTLELAIVYSLSIIAVFTAVGVFFSFFFSASSLQKLANSAWLNFAVAGLFLMFGASLLGLFEIGLPGFLANASSKNENRGGLLGVFFMALTLTITSFTCTFPVVGGLLVMASAGDFFYPIVGLATFASVLAFPFFLLALAPNLISRMPKSGDWMNAVKVVGGLIEIGAALKFINTAELAFVTPDNAWVDAQVVLTAWVALAAVCGCYLLGFFQTDHDYQEVKVGAGRMIFGAAFLGLALYLAPALFGNPPRSLVWDRLIVGILPPDVGELSQGVRVAAAEGGLAPVKAVSTDPDQAEREEKTVHGVQWGMSLAQAREIAAAQNRPILIDFTGVNCSNCRLMEARVFPKPQIVSLLKQFVTVQLYTDFVPIATLTADTREARAAINQKILFNMAKEVTNPFYAVLAPDGKLVSAIGGYNEPNVFQEFLTRALERTSPKVASTTLGN